MKIHFLHIISDGPDHFWWVLRQKTDDLLVNETHSAAQTGYGTYDAALTAGTMALALADAAVEQAERRRPIQ